MKEKQWKLLKLFVVCWYFKILGKFTDRVGKSYWSCMFLSYDRYLKMTGQKLCKNRKDDQWEILKYSVILQ